MCFDFKFQANLQIVALKCFQLGDLCAGVSALWAFTLNREIEKFPILSLQILLIDNFFKNVNLSPFLSFLYKPGE